MKITERVATGIPGLDRIVGGGLAPGELYLLQGDPGTGKTTIGLQFLLEGARRGERCLYISLAETIAQTTRTADAYGWSLDGIELREVRRRDSSSIDAGRAGYTVFSPSEVELGEISRDILHHFESIQPARLVLDSLSEIRLLAEAPSRYRHELLHLLAAVTDRACTGWVIDTNPVGDAEPVAETLVNGIVHLEHLSPAYGGDRRRLRVRKMRASKSVGGYHDFVIRDRGVEVYPRMVAAAHRDTPAGEVLPSGVSELDALLGGGLDRGTSTVFMGPSGTGKSTLVAQFVVAAAARDEGAIVLCFDESPRNLLIRTSGLQIPLADHVARGKVHLVPVDPAELSPGELTYRICRHVDEGARVVVLDSADGFVNALPEERFLAAHLHELLSFLSDKGVVTMLTLAEHGLLGAANPPLPISYIADTIVLLRYFEAAGEVKVAISVTKKRTGEHERSIRELRFPPGGLRLGSPLIEMQGVLTGSPRYLTTPYGGNSGRSR